jgi:tetratricopeptide (TPR) repeat protein
LALDPENPGVLASLYESFQSRRMRDAQQTVVAQMRRVRFGVRGAAEMQADFRTDPAATIDLADAIAQALAQGRPEAAVRMFLDAEKTRVIPRWAASDSVAIALVHLGHPEQARGVWERAADAPSTALRRCRLASAALAALDFATAEAEYRAALKHDPRFGEAWFGLALLYTQRGDAPQAFAAARSGLEPGSTLSPPQRRFLEGIQALAARVASLNGN